MATKDRYWKTADRRQAIVLPDDFETTIADEYHSLSRLHDIIPEHVPEPYELVHEDGRPTAYSTEYLEGEPLVKYLRGGSPPALDAPSVLGQLHGIGEHISKYREPHGDLNRTNVHIRDGREVWITDPAGFPEDLTVLSDRFVNSLQVINWDVNSINRLILEIEKVCEEPVAPRRYTLEPIRLEAGTEQRHPA